MAIRVLIVVCLFVVVAESRYYNDGYVHDNIYEKMPPSCRQNDFCFQRFDKLLQNTVDRVVSKKNLTADTPSDNHQYFIDRSLTDECSSTEQYSPAYFIKDRQNRARVVVQSKHFKQYIYMVSCQSSEPAGQLLKNSDLLYAKLDCVTKYINYKYLVLNRDLTDVEFVETYQGVPVCCTCEYKYEI